jgi:O-antigen/teichoic acid export membrane protein
MSLARTVARNTLWSGLDLIVDLLLPPITAILVARAMGPAKLGAFAYILWISTIAATLGNLGIPMAARKYMVDYAGQRRPDVVLAILRVGLVFQAAIAAVVTGAGLCWVWVFLPPEDRIFATLAILAILPSAMMGVATAVNSTMEQLGPNVIASVVGGLINTAGILATLALDWDLVGLAASLLAGRSADTGLRWLLTLRRLPKYLSSLGPSEGWTPKRSPLPPGLSRELSRFCAQSTVLLLLALIVWNRSEMIFLKWFCGLHEVAYYSVAFGLALVPSQIAGPFAKAADTSLFAERGRNVDRGRHVAELYWRYMAMIVLPACFGLAAVSGPLIRVLYGARYYDAVPVLALAAVFGIAAPLGLPASSLATAGGGQGLLVRCGLVAAVVTIVLDVVLVRSHCAVGGALANGLGQTVSTIIIWVFVARRFGFRVAPRFAVRVALAALGMAAVVLGVVHVLPDLAALVVGPLIGVATYAVLLKAGRVVEAEDVDRLLAVERLFPGRARPYYRKLVFQLASPLGADARTGTKHDAPQ